MHIATKRKGAYLELEMHSVTPIVRLLAKEDVIDLHDQLRRHLDHWLDKESA